MHLVLLHGFAASSFTWREVVDAFPESVEVAALDRPFVPAREAVQATISAIREIGGAPPVLIGHSAGAEIAALTAASGAIEIRALVLEAPVIGTRPPRAVGRVAALPLTGLVAPALLRAGIRLAFHHAFRMAWTDRSKLTASVIGGYRSPLLAPGVAESMWSMTAATDTVEVDWDAIGSLPCLVVRGDRDRWTTPVPLVGADVITYERCGHIPHEEQPERFVADVANFVAAIQKPSASERSVR